MLSLPERIHPLIRSFVQEIFLSTDTMLGTGEMKMSSFGPTHVYSGDVSTNQVQECEYNWFIWEVTEACMGNRGGKTGGEGRVYYQASYHCGQVELDHAEETLGTSAGHAPELHYPEGEAAGCAHANPHCPLVEAAPH